jgi:uncharacterized protein (TIGR00159 family)
MWEIVQVFRWRDAADILLVSAVLYRVFLMFKGTRAVPMVLGLLLLAGVSIGAHRLELFGLSWVLENFWAAWVLVVVVLFQPELRRALTQLGHSRFFQGFLGASLEERSHVVEDVVRAAEALAAKRIGALMVVERATGLRQYAELGVPLEALISSDLLGSIFLPYSPLHDGAVIIQGDRVVSAGCFLPLSRNVEVGRKLGTRHRAALGITEETDAVAVAVSEETGGISLAAGGHLETFADRESLIRRLTDLLAGGESAVGPAPVRGVLRRLWARGKA